MAHEVEIDVGADGRSVQEGQPEVDAQLRLADRHVLASRTRHWRGGAYHAIVVRWNARHENVVAQIVEAHGEISSRRALEEEQVEVGHGRRMGQLGGGSGMHGGGGGERAANARRQSGVVGVVGGVGGAGARPRPLLLLNCDGWRRCLSVAVAAESRLGAVCFSCRSLRALGDRRWRYRSSRAQAEGDARRGVYKQRRAAEAGAAAGSSSSLLALHVARRPGGPTMRRRSRAMSATNKDAPAVLCARPTLLPRRSGSSQFDRSTRRRVLWVGLLSMERSLEKRP